jgi:hypothetical protein
MTRFVRKLVIIGENFLLIIHQDVGSRMVASGFIRDASFAFILVTIAPATRAHAFRQDIDILLPKRFERA